MDKNETYLKGIRDELHKTNIFLGHLCNIMDALLVENDNTMQDEVHPTGSDAVTNMDALLVESEGIR